MEELEFEFDILRNINANLKKKPKDRIYNRSTILKKLNETKGAHDNITEILIILESDLEPDLFHKINKRAKELSSFNYFCLNQLLANTIEPKYKFKNIAFSIIFIIRIRKFAIMANFDVIKTITALVPSYDGSNEKYESIVDALNVVETLITDANRATVINVILTKFTGKARHAFALKPENIETIKNKLKEIISPTPPETIIAKLASCKQKADVISFTTEIETLASQLETAYISRKIPNDVAIELATKEAIKHMASGLKNSQTALILRAGTFKQLTDAVNKVLEVNSVCESSVLLMRTQQQNQTKPHSNEQWKNRNGNNRFENRNPQNRYNNNMGNNRPFPTYQPNYGYRNSNQYNQNNSNYNRNDYNRYRFNNDNFNQRSRNHNQQNDFHGQQHGNYPSFRNNNANQNFNANRGPRNVYTAENGREPAAVPHASCASQQNNRGENQQINQGQVRQAQHPNPNQ